MQKDHDNKRTGRPAIIYRPISQTTSHLIVTLLGLIISAFIVLGVSTSSYANTPARYQLQIQQFKAMLNEQAAADERNLSYRDRMLVERWIGEAEVLLANGDMKETAQRLRRVEYGMELIRSMVSAANIDSLADRQEEAFHSARKQLTEVSGEIDDLRARTQVLERELQRLQDSNR